MIPQKYRSFCPRHNCKKFDGCDKALKEKHVEHAAENNEVLSLSFITECFEPKEVVFATGNDEE